MNELARQAQLICNFFSSKNITAEVFKEHPSGNPDEPHRLYISSKSLGGLLAASNSDGGWLPIFPEKPNYPLKGRWYAPSRFHRMNWREALKASLRPEDYDFGDPVGNRTARERAKKLRHPLRAAAMIALLEVTN